MNPSSIILVFSERLQENVPVETARAAIERFRGATLAELRAFHAELAGKLGAYETRFFDSGENVSRLEQYESLCQLTGFYAIGQLIAGRD
jgi:hypothetical protein